MSATPLTDGLEQKARDNGLGNEERYIHSGAVRTRVEIPLRANIAALKGAG